MASSDEEEPLVKLSTVSKNNEKIHNTSNNSNLNRIMICIGVIIIFLLITMIVLMVQHGSNIPFSSTYTGTIVNDNMNNIKKQMEQCMTDSCEYKVIDLKLNTKNDPFYTFSLPNQILPGSTFLTYSFNLLKGMPPTDLILNGDVKQIISFTYNKSRISAGSKNYLVPDQLDLPSITGTCEQQKTTSSVSSSMSTSSMCSESMESTSESSFDSSVGAGGWGLQIDTSFGMSASYSNSRSTSTSQEQANEQKTSSSYTYSKATLYSTKLLWNEIDTYKNDFIEAIVNLDNVNPGQIQAIVKETAMFIGKYGTHVLELAKMGSRCRETTYMSSTMSSESLSATSEYSASSSKSYKGSFSSRYSNKYGFSASASASYSDSTSSKTSGSTESSSTSESETESSSETLDCIGEVDITSTCGSMLGTQNQPALVGYRMKKIWTLPIFSNYTNAYKYLTNAMTQINTAAQKCGIKYCGGVGVCAINKTFWNSFNYQGGHFDANYSLLWDSSICLNQYQFGTSLLKSGSSISTEMNQCNSTDKIKWDKRYESTQINYDPFCNDNMQIATGLNLINRSVSFESVVSNVQDDGFQITYGLLSNGSYQCTSIGGVSYGTFCQDTLIRTGVISVGPFDSITASSYDVFINTGSPLNCKYGINRQVIAVISGYDYMTDIDLGPAVSRTMQINFVSSINESSVLVNYIIDTDVTFDISVIHFCNDETFFKYGTEEFSIDKEILSVDNAKITENISGRCITAEGETQTDTPSKSSVSCPNDYFMTDCGVCESDELQYSGTYIIDDVCYAKATNLKDNDDSVTACARCCQFPFGTTCFNNEQIGASNVEISCSTNSSVLVGCITNEVIQGDNSDYSISTMGAGDLKDMYVTDELLNSTDTCSATSSVVASTVNDLRISAQCCDMPENYNLECFVLWNVTHGDETTHDDHEPMQSTISCPSGYFTTGCKAFATYGDETYDYYSTEYFINDNNECQTSMTYDKTHGYIMFSQAICCKIKNHYKLPTGSSYLKRKSIQFDQYNLDCDKTEVFVAFSAFPDTNSCSMALWTENMKNDGFNLVLGSWNSQDQGLQYNQTNNTISTCNEVNSSVSVSYLAICQKY